MIGVTCRVLDSMLKDVKYLTHEVLVTLMAEVTAIVNSRPLVATVSKNFKINSEGQNYVHFYVILSRNVKIFGIMASL